MRDIIYLLFDMIYVIAIVAMAAFCVLVVVASCQHNPWLQSEAARRRRTLLRGLDTAYDAEAPQW